MAGTREAEHSSADAPTGRFVMLSRWADTTLGLGAGLWACCLLILSISIVAAVLGNGSAGQVVRLVLASSLLLWLFLVSALQSSWWRRHLGRLLSSERRRS